MPFLDVTDILLDPAFSEEFTVTRSVRVIGDNGRVTLQTKIFKLYGVVTIPSLKQDNIIADANIANRSIVIHSPSRLYDPTVNTVADIISWNGNQYKVRTSANWSNYGRGFTSATCDLIDTTGAV
jgi:hypothetical protein